MSIRQSVRYEHGLKILHSSSGYDEFLNYKRESLIVYEYYAEPRRLIEGKINGNKNNGFMFKLKRFFGFGAKQ